MAKQTKEKESTQKPKKVTKSKNIEKEIIEKENTNDAQDVSTIVPNLEEISKSIDNVDLDLGTESVEKEINDKVEETVQILKETADKISNFEKSKEEFGKQLESNPEKAEELIKNEIKKTEALKASAEKKINSNKQVKHINITSWWNGMGYDM